MGIFESRAEKELDSIIQKIDMNMSNNYKDAAQDALKEFDQAVHSLKESGSMKPQVLLKYENMLDTYRDKMQGFTHKDQKPYWH